MQGFTINEPRPSGYSFRILSNRKEQRLTTIALLICSRPHMPLMINDRRCGPRRGIIPRQAYRLPARGDYLKGRPGPPLFDSLYECLRRVLLFMGAALPEFPGRGSR